MKHVLLVFLGLIIAPVVSQGKRVSFEIDQKALAAQPLCARGFRIISPKYRDAAVPYYSLGKPKQLQVGKSIAGQIESLLNSNACAKCDVGDSLSIAIQDLNFYDGLQPGQVIQLYIHADVFVGGRDALHHIYTIDKWFQTTLETLDEAGYASRFVSNSILSCVGESCKNSLNRSTAAFTDLQADNYYEDALGKYPLYTLSTIPKGIYKTADDLINLTALDSPLIFEHIPAAETDGSSWFYHKEHSGRKGKRVSPADVFAICEGKDLWLSTRGQFRKITQKDGEFYFNEQIPMAAKREPFFNNGPLELQLYLPLERARIAAGLPQGQTLVVLGRFSPQSKTFVPYGGQAPHAE